MKRLSPLSGGARHEDYRAGVSHQAQRSPGAEKDSVEIGGNRVVPASRFHAGERHVFGWPDPCVGNIDVESAELAAHHFGELVDH